MATSERIKWTLSDEGILSIGFGNEVLDLYDVVKVYPTFKEMNEVQKMVIIYGVKQNLSDKIANMKDYTLQEKVKVMEERFQSLVNGIWKSPSKEKASAKKEAAKLVASGELNEVELALLEKLGLK